jgi:hypothetical protein
LTLFAVFLVSSTYYEHVAQESVAPEVPSSNVVQAAGAKALYLLYQKEGFRVDQLTSNWNRLNSDSSLLIVIEPLERTVVPGEIDPLRRWIESGGTLLYLTAQESDVNPNDSVAGDIAVVSAKKTREEATPEAIASPYLENVSRVSVTSSVRLKPSRKAKVTTLLRDSQGIVALQKSLGKGNVIVVADTTAATNATVREADNVLFLMNIASSSVRDGSHEILFDEYHHGVGFTQSDHEGSGLIASMPLPMRLAVWHLAGLGVLLLYNGNRRFGLPRNLIQTPYRPSTDYVGSMARLYRRAGAADIALITLYKQFSRVLRIKLGVAPDTPPVHWIPLAVQKFGLEYAWLQQVISRCDQVVLGERLHETEMLKLMDQLEQLRRRCDLVGPH